MFKSKDLSLNCICIFGHDDGISDLLDDYVCRSSEHKLTRGANMMLNRIVFFEDHLYVVNPVCNCSAALTMLAYEQLLGLVVYYLQL